MRKDFKRIKKERIELYMRKDKKIKGKNIEIKCEFFR